MTPFYESKKIEVDAEEGPFSDQFRKVHHSLLSRSGRKRTENDSPPYVSLDMGPGYIYQLLFSELTLYKSSSA